MGTDNRNANLILADHSLVGENRRALDEESLRILSSGIHIEPQKRQANRTTILSNHLRQLEVAKQLLAVVIGICLVLPICASFVFSDLGLPHMIPSQMNGKGEYAGTLGKEYSSDLRLADANSQSEKPRIAVNGSNVHLVFEDARDGNFEIYYKRSTDNGLTWTEDIRLTSNPEVSNYPAIAVNGSIVHVVWSNWDWKKYMGDSSLELFYKRSEDNGETWTQDVQLTDVFDSMAGWANIAVNDSNVHIVWDDWRDDVGREIYYKRSTDGGHTWSGDIRLTDDPGDSAGPEIAVNGSNIHVIWSDSRPGVYEVFYKNSTDNGVTWSADVPISKLDWYRTFADSIEVYGNMVHVAMVDWIPGLNNFDVYYRRSTDNGDTWDSEVRLTDDPEDQDAADIAVNETNVYVVWQDNRDGIRQIYLRKGADDGTTWGPEIPLTSGDENSLWPEISTNKNQIHVVWFDAAGYLYGAVWQDDRIYYTKSIDDGRTWQDIEILTGTSSVSYLPAVAVDADNIHILWYSFNGSSMGPDIFYKRSQDNGTTWDDDISLVDDPIFPTKYPVVGAGQGNVHVVWTNEKDGYGTEVYYKVGKDNGTVWSMIDFRLTNHIGHSLYPAISVVGSEIHVVWTDDRDGNFEIYYRHSMDNGATWIPETRLTNCSGNSTYPSIAVEGDDVHVVWQDSRDGNWEVYYKNSTDKGVTWNNDARLTDALGGSMSPRVKTSDARIHVVWYDGRNGNSGVYYKRSEDGGLNWTPDVRLTGNSYDSRVPAIGINDSNIYVVWQDSRDGNWEIYYRNSDDSGLNWSADMRLTDAVNSSCAPMIVMNNGYIHLVWVDDRTGLRGIYYKRFLAGALPGRPPTVLQATLSGENSEDVTVEWSLSPDDGMGFESVVGYHIYRNMTYDSEGSGYSMIASLPNGTSVFVDELVGEGDPNNYFYQVCSFDVNNNTSCATDQAAKFTRFLSTGPNLVSIPLVQSDESIEAVLQTLEFDKAWTYDSLGRKWKWFMSFKPYQGELRSVDHRVGLWVNVTKSSNLTTAGIVPSATAINLYEGWNLIGFPSFDTTFTVSDLKAATSSARVEGFDQTASPYHLKVLEDTEVLHAGQGSWVWVDVGLVLLIDTR